MYVIAVYDIASDSKGPQVWRKVFKCCKQYLNHVQNSVFEGELSMSQVDRLKKEIITIIRQDSDSFIVYEIKFYNGIERNILGKEDNLLDNFV